jgi:hypothetical protein
MMISFRTEQALLQCCKRARRNPQDRQDMAMSTTETNRDAARNETDLLVQLAVAAREDQVGNQEVAEVVPHVGDLLQE